MYDTETLSTDGVSNKEHCYGKSCRKYAAKDSLGTLYNFGK